VQRARRHHRLLSGAAFVLLALVAELAGRSLTLRIDLGRHVDSPGNTSADYYPALLAGVKIAIALLLARLAWRLVRARFAERAARGMLVSAGMAPARVPRLTLRLSPRLWALSFATTSLIYLVQTDAEQLSVGRWPLLAPWAHTSALPVFALLSVVIAVGWAAVAGWLTAYERYAEAAVARVRGLGGPAPLRAPRPLQVADLTPRSLFGLAFESRPPPLPA
jgi:hypothetical protein